MRCKKMCLVIVLAIVLSLPINISIYATTVVDGDVKSLGNVSDLNSKHKDIKIIINGLNYFKPIYLKPAKDNQYSISLFEKLYEYGKVRLLIVPNHSGKLSSALEKEVTFDEELEKDKVMYVKLEDNSEYLYNIFITNDNDEFISTHYGVVKIENGHIRYSIQYISDEETIQTEEKVKSIGTQGIVYVNSIFEDEPNNLTTQANTIYSDRNIYGRISSNTDEDYYKITFSSAGTANFWLGDIYKNCDYDLYVYNSSGTEVAHSLNSGQSQELISNFSVTKSTYYVKVKPYGNNFNASKYYFLRVKLSTDSSDGIAWPTSDTYINYCYECLNYTTHKGIDIRGTNANPIVAIASGTVSTVYKTEGLSTYGIAAFIDHDMDNPNSTGSSDKNFQTRYAHMSEIFVNMGEQVSRGKIIGYIGNTGESYGEHLHFETCVGTSRTKVNPTQYYDGNQYCNSCNSNLAKVGDESIISDVYNLNAVVVLNNNNQCVGGSVSFYINNEYILDLESISLMTAQELEKYGVKSEAIKLMIDKMIEENMQEEIKIYMNDLIKISETL